MSVSHLGGVLVIAIIGGLIWQFISLTNSPNRPDRLMYIVAVCFYWMGMVYLAMNIGTTLWNRFLMFGFTISIPLAFLPFTERLIYRRRSTATIICLGLLALSMATFPRQRPLWVTPYSPTEIKNIAAWLKESPYRDDAVLVTQMDWKSTYLPLYFPEVRMGMISSWVEDDEVHDFLRNQHPSLLITWEGESELQARIEYLTKKSIAEHSLIHEEGPIKVYRLRSQP
jgi:hypothetical protein